VQKLSVGNSISATSTYAQRSDTTTSMTRVLHYFFYQVLRGWGDGSNNSSLSEAGLFTSAHSFTVSIGHCGAWRRHPLENGRAPNPSPNTSVL